VSSRRNFGFSLEVSLPIRSDRKVRTGNVTAMISGSIRFCPALHYLMVTHTHSSNHDRWRWKKANCLLVLLVLVAFRGDSGRRSQAFAFQFSNINQHACFWCRCCNLPAATNQVRSVRKSQRQRSPQQLLRMSKSDADKFIPPHQRVTNKGKNTRTRNGQENAKKKDQTNSANGRSQSIGQSEAKAKQKTAENTSDHAISASNSIECDLKTQLHYAREGHAVLRGLLPEKLLCSLRSELKQYSLERSLEAWQQKVSVANGRNLKESSTCTTIEQCQQLLKNKYQIPVNNLPFLQFFNTWQTLPSVESLAKSALLANAAAQLMDIKSVRLYQDSLFFKRCGDGPTPWHIDAKMAPFDTSHMITFWIPMQNIGPDGTGLHFVSKSHVDIALPYWNPIQEGVCGDEHERLEYRYGVDADDDNSNNDCDSSGSVQNYMPMTTGDVTVHSGWTLHCSDSNEIANSSWRSRQRKCVKYVKEADRYALAISYVDARAEVREDVMVALKRKGDVNVNVGSYLGDDEDVNSYLPWIRDVKPRTRFSHRLVPQVWPQQSARIRNQQKKGMSDSAHIL
jgi:hypothetical protein